MPNPKQNEDSTLDGRVDMDESGIDADEERQRQRMDPSDDAMEERPDGDRALDPEEGEDEDDDDDDDLDNEPGVQRG